MTKLTTSQKSEQVKWIEDVIYQIEVQGEVCTSDAQAILEAIDSEKVDQMFDNGVSPFNAASDILNFNY